MDVKNSNCHLTTNLELHEPSGNRLTLEDITLVMLQPDNSVASEVRLNIQVPPEVYHHIENKSLFNLKPEVLGPLTGGDFLPDENYQLNLTLQPDLLPRLFKNATTADEAATYILNLSQEPVDPLLLTENWLCLSVKQQQGDREISLSTFWSYVNPTIWQQVTTSGEQVAEGIAQFFQEWVTTNLSENVQESTDELIEKIASAFEGLAEELSAIDGDNIEDETGNDVERSLFETVVSFFESNDWPIAKGYDETTLQVNFQGNNGQWACYGSTHETRQEFVFYSLCPVNAPEEKKIAMAEFLTRANYGLPLGNFEMDFDSGEIHYKTGIDVEGDRLSIPLVQQVVYSNVMMMDLYLPGIMAILYGKTSPSEAIAQIED